jgi:hypothetical protein
MPVKLVGEVEQFAQVGERGPGVVQVGLQLVGHVPLASLHLLGDPHYPARPNSTQARRQPCFPPCGRYARSRWRRVIEGDGRKRLPRSAGGPDAVYLGSADTGTERNRETCLEEAQLALRRA